MPPVAAPSASTIGRSLGRTGGGVIPSRGGRRKTPTSSAIPVTALPNATARFLDWLPPTSELICPNAAFERPARKRAPHPAWQDEVRDMSQPDEVALLKK